MISLFLIVNKKTFKKRMYISPIDILNISLEELTNIDEKKIIRLEKRLKILKLQQQENFYNQEDAYTLIKQLKDKENRKAIIFIERHLFFKEFITTGKHSGYSTFVFDKKYIENTTILASFLAPYLETYFIPLVKGEYKKKNYNTIIQALKAKDIFTDTTLLKSYQYLEQQTNILNETIKATPAGKLYERQPQVTYANHIELLNSIPIGIIKSTKIDYVNALVDYHNKNLKDNDEYLKINKAYTLFATITVDDPYLEKQLKELSSLGNRRTTYNNSQPKEKEESNSSSVFKIIAFIVIAFIAILRISNSYNSTSNRSYHNYKNNPVFSLDRAYKTEKNQLRSKQYLFIKELSDKAKKKDLKILNKEKLTLSTGSKPYRNFINPSLIHKPFSTKQKDSILIENNSNKSLILFRKYEGEFKAPIFINKKDSIRIGYAKNFELIFYKGKNFSKVSYEDKTATLFTDVSIKDSDLLLQKYVLHGSSYGKNKKVIIKRDTILFIHAKFKKVKNYSVIKALPPAVRKKKVELENYSTKENINWTKNKNSFFNTLKTKLATGNIKPTNYTPYNGENPYPEYFKNYKNIDISGFPVLVKNKTKEHLILFNRNLSDQRDFATYIKPANELTIYLYEEGDSLYFFKGKNFFNYKKIKMLNMNTNNKKTFSKPIIIKGFLLGTPTIIVKEDSIELSEIKYE